ncbi:Uma2 family endonuclease [Spinactinospora alkalitolerans]|uniref:Uma2 family endonuclease n=1 Tax=Spinactinospora alkalitolerans TaxID=687207 RepID=A0A852TV13_9ACTN|nr:Uma2 family endonuclease [Spinactinospora alkalitolerans]NYE48296.1 Uma2 family endonuclease [Spinactinospora alkalitolerans]
MTTFAPEKATAADGGRTPQSVELFALLDAMDLPRGVRAEVLDGETITVSACPVGKHQRNVRALDLQLTPRLPEGYDNETYLEIRMPHLDRSVVPDLFVAPKELLITDDHMIPPDDVLLVAEVASKGKPNQDRVTKLEIYAEAVIEFYLLIDPLQAQATLYSNPQAKQYKEKTTRDFGEKLTLPKPFDFDLDTGEFLPYG